MRGFDWATARIRPIAARRYGERLTRMLPMEAREEFEALKSHLRIDF